MAFNTELEFPMMSHKNWEMSWPFLYRDFNAAIAAFYLLTLISPADSNVFNAEIALKSDVFSFEERYMMDDMWHGVQCTLHSAQTHIHNSHLYLIARNILVADLIWYDIAAYKHRQFASVKCLCSYDRVNKHLMNCSTHAFSIRCLFHKKPTFLVWDVTERIWFSTLSFSCSTLQAYFTKQIFRQIMRLWIAEYLNNLWFFFRKKQKIFPSKTFKRASTSVFFMQLFLLFDHTLSDSDQVYVVIWNWRHNVEHTKKKCIPEYSGEDMNFNSHFFHIFVINICWVNSFFADMFKTYFIFHLTE